MINSASEIYNYINTTSTLVKIKNLLKIKNIFNIIKKIISLDANCLSYKIFFF